MLRLRLAMAVAMTLVVMGMEAASAQAFQRHILTGAPGTFSNVYNPALEAGICDAPTEPAACSDGGNGSKNQMFLNGVKTLTATYSPRQTINLTAFLYFQTTTGSWKQAASDNVGTCFNLAGGGSGACQFGSPSPDQISGGNCAMNSAYCHPIFVNVVRNRNWTAKLRVTWKNASTGAVLAKADYFTYSTGDLGCAAFAHNQGRCNGPFSAAKSNLPSPAKTVTYVEMP
jgi:hypothetical protein